MAERLFDQIVKKDQEAYDEKMIPFIEAETKANFEATVREGQKRKISYEKWIWDAIYKNPSEYDLNEIADKKLMLKAIDEKIEVIKGVYKDLFGEEMK